MKLVTAEQMREIDRKTIEEFEIPGEILMDRAGKGVAESVLYFVDASGIDDPFVQLVAGKGNNGGDAFVVARYLAEHGYDVELLLAAKAEDIKGDALLHFESMKESGVPCIQMLDEKDWEKIFSDDDVLPDVIVDGILGTGISGPARDLAASAIQYINNCSSCSLVVAIDVPSGLNSDTGTSEGEVVKADLTLTMGLPKLGLVEPHAKDHVGSIEVVDIGVPDELIREVKSSKEMIVVDDLSEKLDWRGAHSHKGNFGHVLLIGGASGFSGAIAMAAKAAVRSGAGLVTVLTPEKIASIVAGIVPEAMVHPAAETEEGSLHSECIAKWGKSLNDFDAILVGPGMTTHNQTKMLVEQIISECEKPLIMDADALNVCSSGMITKAKCSVVITPHPGEMARLMECSIPDVQKDRCKSALDIAQECNAIVVLKGAGTIVVEKSGVPHINATGNPGMATGGMGDVLGGLLVGLAAQSLAPFDAARIAVYIHGRAGDNAAWGSSQSGMTASDVIEELPYIFREITDR